jgi:hypothetical protein|tara:strand:- start:1005 stop:1223 length:219 start_codon:yes stop_codon:yes gene_type:complete
MGMICLDTPEQIQMARYLTMRSGLKLEIQGMRLSRGVNCYKMVKDTFGLKGSKQKVLEQFEELLAEAGVNLT